MKTCKVLWTLFEFILTFVSLSFSSYHILIQVYEGAVYLNQGKTYLVTSLDLSRKIAWCKEADLKYYTKILDSTDIHVVGGNVVCQALNICCLVLFVPFHNLNELICYLEMHDGVISHNLGTD